MSSKRVSVSKMTRLSDVAKKCFEVCTDFPHGSYRGPFCDPVLVASCSTNTGCMLTSFLTLSHFQNDAKMVSTLYRTHKALQPQFKVPSLYAFDALARAARNHAIKHGFAGDTLPGNSATFLLKLEAILEGLFRDMMGPGVPEGKVSKAYTVTLLITLGRISCVSCHSYWTLGRFVKASAAGALRRRARACLPLNGTFRI